MLEVLTATRAPACGQHTTTIFACEQPYEGRSGLTRVTFEGKSTSLEGGGGGRWGGQEEQKAEDGRRAAERIYRAQHMEKGWTPGPHIFSYSRSMPTASNFSTTRNTRGTAFSAGHAFRIQRSDV